MSPIERDAANLALEKIFKVPMADYLKGVPEPEQLEEQPSQLKMARKQPVQPKQPIKTARPLPSLDLGPVATIRRKPLEEGQETKQTI